MGLVRQARSPKIVVVDGSVAFVGSLNIGTEYSGGHGEDSDRWRDVGIRVCGPAVTELQRLICESWERETGVIPEGCLNGSANPPETGDAVIHIVGSRPHKDRSSIRNAFRYTIAGASHEIMIANPYFVPGPRVIRSLLRAAKRGVRVRLILPEVNDVPLVQLVSRSTYAQLLKGGVEIYERQGTVLHAKVMLIDGYWSVMGSANLDQRSFHRNYEVNLIIDSVTFGDQVEKMLENDLLFSRPVVLEEHEQRGFLIRFMERVVAPVSWFL